MAEEVLSDNHWNDLVFKPVTHGLQILHQTDETHLSRYQMYYLASECATHGKHHIL